MKQDVRSKNGTTVLFRFSRQPGETDLSSMGIPKAYDQLSWRWTSCFLSTETMPVEINGDFSKRFLLNAGSPRGSALPLPR